MLRNLRTSNPSLFARRRRRLTSNGGGIHHMVRDPVLLQKPMQPEAVATRFIATHHGSAFWQTHAVFGRGDVVEHMLLLPCGHSTLTRLLTMARGAAELPSFFTQ